MQRATSDTLTPMRYQETVSAVADALAAVWPEFARETGLARLLRANTAVLASRAEHTGCLYQPRVHDVLFLAGDSAGNFGQASAAAAYYRNLPDNAARHLGPGHPDTFKAHNRLALWHGIAGDPAGAIAALSVLLDDQLRELGPGHPDTFNVRQNLAVLQGRRETPPAPPQPCPSCWKIMCGRWDPITPQPSLFVACSPSGEGSPEMQLAPPQPSPNCFTNGCSAWALTTPTPSPHAGCSPHGRGSAIKAWHRSAASHERKVHLCE